MPYLISPVKKVLDVTVDYMFWFFSVITGFVFSENEHTALEQFEGGPCAVIAPVQVWSCSVSI